MNWEVKLTGNPIDLDSLVNSLHSGTLRVTKKNNAYFLESSAFDSLDRHEEVQRKAEEMAVHMSGSVRVVLQSRTPIQVANVVEVFDNGKRRAFVLAAAPLACELRVSPSALSVAAGGAVQTSCPTDQLGFLVGIAQSDANVAKAFRLLCDCAEDSWGNLYCLLEVVQEDVGSLKVIVEKGWASNGALERFKHTANSPGAVGDAARHGKEPTQPPKKPLDLDKARSLVHSIVRKWLDFKASSH